MALTLVDVMDKYRPATGYTHSDEFTLIFPAIAADKPDTVHLHNGKVFKLCTLVASYTSVRFAFHMRNEINANKEHYKPAFVEKVNNCTTCFDARLLEFPKEEEFELVNHMIWRSNRDCYRNSVSKFAREYYSAKQLHGKKTQEKLDMMLTQGFDFKNDPRVHLQYGIYAKRELYEKISEHVDTPVLRSRTALKCLVMQATDPMLELLLAKNWPTTTLPEGVTDFSLQI
jgi:hypothetical protein